jgi:Transposase, Mutator family
VPLLAFSPAIRKMIYATNAVENPHRGLRKIIKTRGNFPTDAAAIKLLFQALRNAGVHWRKPVEWTAAMGQFAILFEDRLLVSARCGRKASPPRLHLHKRPDRPEGYYMTPALIADSRNDMAVNCDEMFALIAGTDYYVPFGGRKNSSFGPRAQGRAVVEFHTRMKTGYVRLEEPE